MVPTPELPLSGMANSTYFKVYMSDVGLLRRKSNVNYRTFLNGDASICSATDIILRCTSGDGWGINDLIGEVYGKNWKCNCVWRHRKIM